VSADDDFWTAPIAVDLDGDLAGTPPLHESRPVCSEPRVRAGVLREQLTRAFTVVVHLAAHVHAQSWRHAQVVVDGSNRAGESVRRDDQKPKTFSDAGDGTPTLAACLAIGGDVRGLLELCITTAVDFLAEDRDPPDELIVDLQAIASSSYQPDATRASSLLLALCRRKGARSGNPTTNEREN
jgi:hypothetical protein